MSPLETTLRECNRLIAAKQLLQAEQLLAPVLRQLPEEVSVLILMSQLRAAQYRPDEAVSYIERALGLCPDHVPLHRELAAQHIIAGAHEKALAQYRLAVDLRDDLPESHHSIGDMLRRIGRFKAAEQQFRQTIQAHPTYTLTFAALADLVKFEPDDPLFTTINELLNSGTIPAGDRQHLHFALGKMYDDIGEFDQAFEHYRLGNRFANRRFDLSKNRQMIDDIIDSWGSINAVNSSSDASPVFILGMPRSGSTLVEQILASHPQVWAAGETPFVKNMVDTAAEIIGTGTNYPQFRGQLSTDLLNQLAAEYVWRMAKAAGAPSTPDRLVDKMPVNFIYIGFIMALYPRARIIHTRRHPLDVCLSCYFHNFTGGLNYTFDLHTLGQVYLDYQRLMGHWQSLYPENILQLDYEYLVANQEQESRKLIEFIGLQWDADCLDFHTNQRPFGSASLVQARQPIYRKSLQRWRHYSQHLQPLAATLGVSTAADSES